MRRIAGVNGAFLTADLFNLYVCFEVMLMASFVLLVLGVLTGTAQSATTFVVVLGAVGRVVDDLADLRP